MAVSSIGAKGIEREEFDCVIRKISCKNKKGDIVILYEREEDDVRISSDSSDSQNNLTLKGYVCFFDEKKEFYVVTDHNGQIFNFKCNRENNSCIDEEHRKYTLDYIDIDTHEIKTLSRSIESQEIKYSYYNLFSRSQSYAKSAASSIHNAVKDNDELDAVEKTLATATAYGLGTVAGDIVDTKTALRFMFLPSIDAKDYEYECHAVLAYHECPHYPTVQDLYFHIYPAIEYNLNIGFRGKSRTFNASDKKRDKNTQTKFSFEFKIKYASHSSGIEIKKEDEKEFTKKEQRGAIFYKTINSIGAFFRESAAFTENLIKNLSSDNQEGADKISTDLRAITRTSGTIGNKLAKPSWIYGDISVQPSISALWRYETSADMKQLQRHLEIEFGLELSGKLTIDLVKLALHGFNKAKKISTVATAAAAIATGGLGTLPAVLIKFLVESVLTWLMDKFEEGVILQIILSGDGNLPHITYNSSNTRMAERFELGINAKIQLELLAKLSFTASIVVTTYVKVEGKAEAYANVSASVSWEGKINVRNMIPGIEQEVKIDPLKIKVGFMVAGGYEIWIFKSKNTFKERSKEWSFKGISYNPERVNFFKVNEGDDTQN